MGHLVDIMLGKFLNPKYVDPRNQIMIVNINNMSIPKTLIDLGVSINVMTKDTMLKLNLQSSLRHTTIML